MSHKVLVAYATNSGSTAEVADAIGKELSRNGLGVETQPVRDVKDIAPYDWVIVAGPLIFSAWHSGAVEFLKKYELALSRIPVAYFFTGTHVIKTGETTLNGIPLAIDPDLLKEPKNPARLSFTENYATVGHYLRPVLQAVPGVKPVSVGFFAGKMDYARLKLPDRLFAQFVARMEPGDRRNWEAIRNWAKRLPVELIGGPPIGQHDRSGDDMTKEAYRESANNNRWLPPYPDLAGKVAMVTGANDGIGRATALGLAKLGATVVMVCRDRQRGEAAQAVIRAESGNLAVELMLADLSSQAAIRSLAAAYQRTHAHLHILVNNAGATANQRTVTADGVELSMAVNHLAPFLLTNLLLDVLKANAPARIVNVTSAGEMMGRIDFEDLMGERAYSPARAYSQSKLANVLFTYELARRLQGTGVTVNCLHPGFVKTKMTAQDNGSLTGLMIRLARPFALTPEQGAQTTLYLAASPEVQGVSGMYFENQREKRSSPRSYDTSVAQRLWQVSQRLTAGATEEVATAVLQY